MHLVGPNYEVTTNPFVVVLSPLSGTRTRFTRVPRYRLIQLIKCQSGLILLMDTEALLAYRDQTVIQLLRLM